ncbi:MAG TPA: adenosylcobinamide-GDP ribazoletransferase [Herpetosiphonaceae bacterium]|nr:adenosylcobinamide-GDP ribazoletransferase [Herpetosiphonaceae bacterium]
MVSLAVAFGFLTVLPVPANTWTSAKPLGRAFTWFPLVGLVLGGILALAALGLVALLPESVVAALLLALGVLLTGGLHLDGLMDTCDGVFCLRSPEERLTIMRDSHAGAFGVLGAVCLLLMKFTALGALLAGDRQLLFGGLLIAPMLSRWAMVLAAVCFPYGRTGETLGSSFHRTVEPMQLATATVGAGMLTVLLGLALHLGFRGLAAFAGAAVLTYLVAHFALSRIPGLTGDVYGAINEIVEAMALVVFTLR